MKLPKFVYPAGVEFKVVRERFEQDLYGETVGPERCIKITDMPQHRHLEWDTLFHEYLHAIFYATGLSELTDEKSEEAIVTAFEIHLIHLIDKKKLGRPRD